MRRFLIVLAGLAVASNLTGCGSRAVVHVVERKERRVISQEQVPNVIEAADTAISRAISFAVAAAAAKATPTSTTVPSSPVPVVAPTPPAISHQGAAATVFDCIAQAETGSDFTMHGPTYSTAYGVINDIVYDYATPEVAARILSGTATKAEQLDVVARFADDHGFGGWGVLTKQKCGLS